MDNKQKVYDWIDSHQEDIVKLLQELIQAPSVNAYLTRMKNLKMKNWRSRFFAVTWTIWA